MAIDGRTLGARRIPGGRKSLTIAGAPDGLPWRPVEINPAANTALEGLYMSGGMFCTQCEAEGFRRITYFLDRPDVLSVFTVRIEAEQAPIRCCCPTAT